MMSLKMTRMLVCGGRHYNDRDNVFTTLDAFHKEHHIELVMHGGAKGADFLAHEWASKNKIVVRIFIPDWDQYGKRAGPVRNRKMLTFGRPNLVVAFPGGSGTEDMISQAMKAAIPVYRITKEGRLPVENIEMKVFTVC